MPAPGVKLPETQDETETRSDSARRAGSGWLDGHIPASIPYIIGFAVFIPALLAANIGLEFWLDPSDPWLTNLRDGLLNAGVMATWGIPLTIIATEGVTRMWARDYIARKEQEAGIRFRQYEAELTERIRQEVAQEMAAQIAASDGMAAQREERVALREERVAQQAALVTWYVEQVAKWQERQRQALAAGKEFNEPAPEPPPGVKTG